MIKPPFPEAGDIDKEITYAAVGYALDCWEGLEVNLCGLYAAYNGLQRAETVAINGYSNGRIFVDRMSTVAQASSMWSIKNPDQSLESEFSAIQEQVVAASAFRNEIAHGCLGVFSESELPVGVRFRVGEAGTTWCLVPPFYNYRKNVFKSDKYLDFKPCYVYVSGQIRSMGYEFSKLRHEVYETSLKIMDRNQPSPKSRTLPL